MEWFQLGHHSRSRPKRLPGYFLVGASLAALFRFYISKYLGLLGRLAAILVRGNVLFIRKHDVGTLDDLFV